MDFSPPNSITKPMGRPPKFRIAATIRLDKITLARIDKVLRPKEKRVDLIRVAVERELNRREKIKLR